MRLDESACSGCGQPRPEGGWLAEPVPPPPARSKKGLIVLGIVAAIAAIGIVPLRGSRSFLGLTHQWVPQVGMPAQIRKNTVLCSSYGLLEELGAKMFRDPAVGHGAVRGTHVPHSVPRGCFFSQAPATVTVVDLKGLSFPSARVRLHNGKAYWMLSGALTAPVVKPLESRVPPYPTELARRASRDSSRRARATRRSVGSASATSDCAGACPP